MNIEHLDLDTRNKIYNHTKKVLRKYQKGIITGKLTADKFADNILSTESLKEFLDESITSSPNFKNSYTNYIDKLITIQNKDFSKSKHKARSIDNKPTISQKIKLNNLLNSSGYSLSMPIEYLSANDIESIIKYINEGLIDVGNEKIYKYVYKSETVH